MEFFGDDSNNQSNGDDQAPNLLASFARELEEGISNLEQKIVELEHDAENSELINAIFRAFHNLKGSSTVVGFRILPELMHFSESLFERVRSGKSKISTEMVGILLEVLGAMRDIRTEIKATGKEGNKRYFAILAQLESMTTLAADAQSQAAGNDSGEKVKDESKKSDKASEQDEYIKIARSLVDQLMLIVGDFMLVESAFQFMLKQYGNDWSFVENCQQLAHFSNKLQNTVLRMRLSPIKPVFSSMHRLVRNTAQEIGKLASLEIAGADTLVDRSILDVISDPLVHMLRNSIDHGIEHKDERIKLGKSPEGQVTLSAFHRSGEVVIQISDDGKGIDPQRMKRKALEMGFLNAQDAQNLSENELQNLIFLPGLSGADVVTNVSGRGVGMDVVKQTVERLGGNVDLVSSPGNGTTISLRLPLSMAISECLEIRLGERSYAVPQVCIDEVFSMESPVIKEHIRTLNDGGRVLLLRDTPIPVLHLGEIFGIGREIGDPHLIQVRYGNTKFAIEVGAIVGPCNIVCQPLPAVFAAEAPFSGLTRRGDGSLMFQIDLGRLATKIHQQTEAKTPGVGAKMRGGTAITSSDLRRLQQKIAYFTNYEHFCVPVQGIKRIVSVHKSDIHLVDNRKYITLDGTTIPLVWAEEQLLKRPHIEKDEYAVIIYQLEEKSFGLPMDQFRGIVRMPTQYDNTLRSDAITGTTVIDDHTVSVIDLFGLTSRVFGSEITIQARKNVKVNKVIIAEDDPFFREQLIAFLKSREISAIAFPDGLATKEYMDNPANLEGIGAVLSDVEMPRMDGLSLTRWIKGHDSTKHLPVLIITSLTNKEVLRLAMSAGASSFIAKMHHQQVMTELKRIEAGLETKEMQGQHGGIDGDSKTIQRRAVTFSLAGHLFAIPMDVLKEVSHISKNLPLPDCQPWIDRVTAFRGKMVPVIDLIRLFDFDEKTSPKELHQIIVDWNGNIVALLVDAIGEVVLMSQLTAGEGVGKASLKDLKIAPYLKGIFQKDSRIISLIDPAAIVNIHQQKGLIIQKKETAA
jgi:two-component system chemotaxis sensor kinase CheA